MPSAKLRFRDYELDPDGCELCRAGHRLRLERKPMELLILLTEKQGQLVKREEIIEKIWGKDFFFDAENGVNNAIRKIRSALNDDPSSRALWKLPLARAIGLLLRLSACLSPPAQSVLRPVSRASGRRRSSGGARGSPLWY